MALQSSASTSNPLLLSEIFTEFDYWQTGYVANTPPYTFNENHLRSFVGHYSGVGPAGAANAQDDPPTNALNMISFLGKEGGGTYSYTKTGTYPNFSGNYWCRWQQGTDTPQDPEDPDPWPYDYDWKEGYILSYGSTTITLTGDAYSPYNFPNNPANYYDYGGYRYFRGFYPGGNAYTGAGGDWVAVAGGTDTWPDPPASGPWVRHKYNEISRIAI